MMKAVSWFVGVFFALMAVSMLSSSHLLSALLMLIAALIIMPKTKIAIQACLTKKDDNFVITNPMALVTGFILFIASTFFMNKKEVQLVIAQPVEVASIVLVKKEETKPLVYIDEVFKLQQLTQQLVDYKYQPPYSSYKTFAKIKKNLAISIEPTCAYFDELVTATGNNNSPHREQAIRCSDTVFSMTTVMLDIRGGDYNAIAEQRKKLITINTNLLNQLEEYKQTPEYKAEMKSTKTP